MGEETNVLHLAILIDGPALWSRPGSEEEGSLVGLGFCFSASGSGITNAKQGGARNLAPSMVQQRGRLLLRR